MLRLLFVDNNPVALARLRRSLRRYVDQWVVEVATGGQEALEKLSLRDYDVVVSELKMPGMDGSQLLSQVRDRCPQALRIIQRDFAAEESVYRTLSPAHQALEKPYEITTLHSAIKRAMALRDRLDDRQLQAAVADITTLPSLPGVYSELIDELNCYDTSMERVGAIISRDVGMTAKILQLVNSSFFGLGTRVTDPTHAASFLGMSLVRSLVLTVGVFAQFDQQSCPDFSLQQLVEHSIIVGRTAQKMARRRAHSPLVHDDALLAGVLHDVGKIVLATGIRERYQRVLHEMSESGQPLWQVEKSVLGITHGDVAGYLLALWGFPPSVVEAVTFHHEPTQSASGEFDALAAVYLSNVLVHLEAPGDSSAVRIERAYVDQLGFGQGVTFESKPDDPPLLRRDEMRRLKAVLDESPGASLASVS